MLANSVNTPKNNIGLILSTAIERAVLEHRVVIGLTPAINYLTRNGVRGPATDREVIFCVLVSTEETVVHMHNTLLQAYCNENGVDIIRVDSAAKLSRLLLCADSLETCVLLLSGASDSGKRPAVVMTGSESALAHYCDGIWSPGRKQSITLPDQSSS